MVMAVFVLLMIVSFVSWVEVLGKENHFGGKNIYDFLKFGWTLEYKQVPNRIQNIYVPS